MAMHKRCTCSILHPNWLSSCDRPSASEDPMYGAAWRTHATGVFGFLAISGLDPTRHAKKQSLLLNTHSSLRVATLPEDGLIASRQQSSLKVTKKGFLGKLSKTDMKLDRMNGCYAHGTVLRNSESPRGYDRMCSIWLNKPEP